MGAKRACEILQTVQEEQPVIGHVHVEPLLLVAAMILKHGGREREKKTEKEREKEREREERGGQRNQINTVKRSDMKVNFYESISINISLLYVTDISTLNLQSTIVHLDRENR